MTTLETGAPPARPTTLAEMIAAGRYDLVNAGVTDEKFPVKPELYSVDNLVLVSFTRAMADADVNAELIRMGFADATIEQLLAYGEKNPDEQRQGFIIARASVWVRGDGSRYLPYLAGDANERRIGLGWADAWSTWGRQFRFLARCK